MILISSFATFFLLVAGLHAGDQSLHEGNNIHINASSLHRRWNIQPIFSKTYRFILNLSILFGSTQLVQNTPFFLFLFLIRSSFNSI